MKIVDLSLPIHQNMLTFNAHWHPKVEISILGQHEREGRETRKILLGSHTGTHIDAPSHFVPNANGIDSLPLERLIGKCHLVSFPNCKPMRQINVQDVKPQLADIEHFHRIIFRFDWARYWNTEKYYLQWPYLSDELCHWLLEKNVFLVGMDTPSPDNPHHNRASGNDSPIHKLLLSNDVILLEYLSNLENIDSSPFQLVALPLKIKDADGSPARIIAILD